MTRKSARVVTFLANGGSHRGLPKRRVASSDGRKSSSLGSSGDGVKRSKKCKCRGKIKVKAHDERGHGVKAHCRSKGSKK
jgi:hypothetical protein